MEKGLYLRAATVMTVAMVLVGNAARGGTQSGSISK